MATTKRSALTQFLLLGGVLAGPFYIALAIFQMIIRDGYDPTRHDVSLMGNGELGWIQVVNFLVTGLLVLLATFGLRRVLKGQKGGTWGPLLLGLYGLGLLGAGLFVADPMNGFPLGTPDGPPAEATTSGTLHIVTGAIGFIGLIASTFVLARYFGSRKEFGWKKFSIITGIVYLGGFFGIAAGAQQKGVGLQVVTLLFTAAVVLGWTWISVVSAKLKRMG